MSDGPEALLQEARELERDANAVMARMLTESVPADEVVAAFQKLSESTRIRRLLGLLDEVVDDVHRAIELKDDEFAGVEDLTPAGRTLGLTIEIPADGQWRVINGTLYDNAYAIGSVRDVSPPTGVRIVYRPRGV